MRVILLSLCVAAASSQQLIKIGDLQTLQHGVSGEVYAVDENHIRIKHFNYDGTGPDAYFWIGTEGTPDNTDEFKTAVLAYPFKGKHFTYRDESAPVLLRAEDEDVVLTLPPEIKVSSLKWISVWCRKFTVDFGHLIFPEGLRIPSGDSEEPELPPPRIAPSSTTRFPASDYDDHTAQPEPEPESEPEPAAGDKWPKPGSTKPSSSKPEPRPRAGAAGQLSCSLAALTSTLLLSLIIMF